MAETSVLFVCVSNAGKSVMAAGLMRHLSAPNIHIASAGTHAKTAVNTLSAQVLAEVGVDISGHQPTQLTDQMLDDADLVVIVGSQAHLDNHPGTRIQRWDTDEPSLRGIDGIQRMRIIRDDINTRVQALADELSSQSS
ncbi:MAG TPA: low molecular weight phosphatase family protein [Mycobacterium sp.]|uniref:arsenate-mycothiol transferase ArsC n=1 Tax=Mycobacteriaceae TaxID=1762 RepID=UPI0008019E77|nr:MULTISPECIES: low molecular weight phosphatase family protein [Mycobacteriaceae]MCB0937437.1 low molecular weight phosphatase family protein [Mycobacterium sp.]TXH12432.1 MAG: low molecular weight phosphatase family protein [Gammaproteobacteria bacterium]MCB1286672.1 low molecular weight phosphatase family protein [Mycobacterium sp.]OBB41757.1 protein tyrosine phosphatase [Mycobacterium sp. 852002-51961_SCH5331710]HRD11237.1 low molecular weight phosphatase family protein [Mycobacterium sp.